MEKNKSPRELAIEKEMHPFYEKLKDGEILPELKNYEMAHLFIIAMAYGSNYNKRKPIKDVKRSISRAYVENKYSWLVKSLAISEEGLEVITDEGKMYNIAEEYANGGIYYIKKLIENSSPGEFQNFMEHELRKILETP